MNGFRLFLPALLVFSFSALFLSEARAEKITMLDHLKEVNKILCKCDSKGGSAVECEKKLNGISALNKNNAKTMIDDVQSSICVGYLEATDCSDVITESTAGPCSLEELQKE